MDAKLTVIVVSRDLWKMTQKCLETMIFTADVPWRLFFYSNGSVDETKQSYPPIAKTWNWQYLCGKNHRHNPKSIPLAAAWNDAYKRAMSVEQTEYVMFANNDIEFYKPGWMSKMISMLESGLDLVGIQEMTWYKFRFVEGSLFVAKQSTLDAMSIKPGKVFDTRFKLSCEDVDLSERFLRAGLKIGQVEGLQPGHLVHIGHQTIDKFAQEDGGIIEKMHASRRVLCKKYGFDSQVED